MGLVGREVHRVKRSRSTWGTFVCVQKKGRGAVKSFAETTAAGSEYC